MEVRVLEEHQRTDASHSQFQATEERLIRIVEEVGNLVNGIMAECVTMADRLEGALLGDGPGDAAPVVEVEMEPMEEDPEKDPSEAVWSSSLVHLY